MSPNTHVTLLTNLASSEPVTSPVTSPALVPPWNSSALEAPLSQLQTDSRDSRNLVLRSNSGITNTDLNITVSSLVQFQFLFLFLFLFLSRVLTLHSCVFPSSTHHFPVFWSVFRYVPVPNGYAPWLVYIDPHLVLYSICSNINFYYCSHCLLDLWSLPTFIQLL